MEGDAHPGYGNTDSIGAIGMGGNDGPGPCSPGDLRDQERGQVPGSHDYLLPCTLHKRYNCPVIRLQGLPGALSSQGC